ncbi:MAG: hypothetical protein R2799_15785 [Crocinitomicaceae bacterium]|nr:hypothetical protein [Crocinitomicaceae bacterium]
MNIKSFLLIGIFLFCSGLFAQGKAEPNKNVSLHINGNKVELVDSKVKIADLKNATLVLKCENQEVKINKHVVTYSSKDLNKIASLEGEGAPKDLSSPNWEATVDHKHMHAGSLVLIKLTYTVAYFDGDAEKESTWMIELE